MIDVFGKLGQWEKALQVIEAMKHEVRLRWEDLRLGPKVGKQGGKMQGEGGAAEGIPRQCIRPS